MYTKLFCPGPTNVSEDVLQKMASPLISNTLVFGGKAYEGEI